MTTRNLTYALCKFRWLDTGLSLRRPGFDPVPVYMEFMLYKVAVGQVVLEVFHCPFVITNSQVLPTHVLFIHYCLCRSQWLRGLRRWSTAARLLRLGVRIPSRACMFICCKCCLLSGTGLCDELITRPEESYRLWCVVCDLETS